VLVLFLLWGFVVMILRRFAHIDIWGYFSGFLWIFRYFRYIVLDGALYALVGINILLLPVINVCLVCWKAFAQKIEQRLPWIFPGVGGMARPERAIRLGCSSAILALSGYAALIEPNLLQVKQVEIVSEKVAEPVTILHLTDMHLDESSSWTTRKLFRKIQQLDPDIILQTGDLMDLYTPEDRDEEFMGEVADLFRQLTPRYGTYWIVGNHDYGLENFAWFYERAGVTLLHDDEWLIAGDAGRFRLLGLSCDKSWWNRDAGFIKAWANRAGDDEFTIVMGHTPDYIPEIVDQDIDLCLAGHLHGGQVSFPIVDRILLKLILHELGSDHVSVEWAKGFREVGNTRINVSVGTGGGAPRLNCPPAMTLFTVKKP
jgi:predicted MPP superfamily phosphohydrolase